MSISVRLLAIIPFLKRVSILAVFQVWTQILMENTLNTIQLSPLIQPYTLFANSFYASRAESGNLDSVQK